MLGPAIIASCVAQLAMRPTFVTFGDSITQRGFAPGWTGQLADAYQRRADVINRGGWVGKGEGGPGSACVPAGHLRLPSCVRNTPCARRRRRLLRPPHPPHCARPAGYSGYNSRWALHLLDRVFPLGTAAPPPALVTIFFGANDAALPDRGS